MQRLHFFDLPMSWQHNESPFSLLQMRWQLALRTMRFVLDVLQLEVLRVYRDAVEFLPNKLEQVSQARVDWHRRLRLGRVAGARPWRLSRTASMRGAAARYGIRGSGSCKAPVVVRVHARAQSTGARRAKQQPDRSRGLVQLCRPRAI